MKKKSGLFVKINYKMSADDIYNITDKRAKTNSINLTKYLYCAGTFNKNGGTMIFRAENFEEAKLILDNNPFINMDKYNYEILSRNSIYLQ